MPTMQAGLAILLFTYGFTIAYHVMGSTKFYILKKFQMKKALLGIYQELGYFLFLFLLFILPIYVDLETIGVELELDKIMTIVLVIPMVMGIKKCYEKAVEIKGIDVSEIDTLIDGEEGLATYMMTRSDKELNVNVTLKGDIDYAKKETKTKSTKTAGTKGSKG